MDFSFPSFSRASTDLPFQQPPQKSLLELVIEAKGQLGLVPQRKAERRNPTASFSAFSDSDEEGDDNVEGSGGDAGGAHGMSVLTTRTAWVPSTHLLDYFFSGQFLQSFLTLHNLSSSRAASALAPPLLSVRDLHLHPMVEAALCAALLESGSHTQHQHQQQQYQQRGGRGGSRGGRGGRDMSGWESEGRDTATTAAAAAAFPLWEVAKLEQLKEAVFGDKVGDTAAPLSPSAPPSHFFSGVRDDAAQRVLLRGLQQLALPALLLGDHVLLSGPRGVGKRTAVLLAAAANMLTYGASATIAEQENSAGDEGAEEEKEEEEKEAAASPSREEVEGDGTPTSTAAQKTEVDDAVVKSEPADASESARVEEEGAGEAAAETQSGRPLIGDSGNTAAPRALFVVSSYADVGATARWLERVFGPEAFKPYTFERDSCALRPVLDEAALSIPAPATFSSGVSGVGHGSSSGVAPSQMLPPGVGGVASRGAYLTPPVPVAVLPFITDTAMTAEGVLADVDPTQASTSAVLADVQGGGVLGQSEGPDLSELAALVQGAELPVSLPSASTAKASEDRKRRRRSSSRNARDDDDDDSDDYSDRGRRHRTSPRHGDHRSSRRSHRSHRSSRKGDMHRRYSDDDDDDSRCSSEDERVHRRRSSHRSSHHRSRRHRSSGHRSPSDDDDDAGSSRHRSRRSHRSYSEEREERRERDRHRDSRHSSRHHRRPRDEDEKEEEEETKMRDTAAETPRSAPFTSFADNVGSTTAALSLDSPALPSDVFGGAVLPSASTIITSTPLPVLPSTAPPVLPSPSSQPTLPIDRYAWLPPVLRQRLPIIITTYAALQSAMAVVDGVASALPPLEQVRVAVFTHLDKALQPPLKESFRHSWWVSLVNALDIECQFMTTTDRSGAEVMGFLTSTILPDAGEGLLHLDQRDASIWAMMDVQLSPVGVEVTAAATTTTTTAAADSVPAASRGRQQKQQQQRPKISGTDIDAAKLTHLFSLVVEHVTSSHSAPEVEVDAPAGGGAPRRGSSGCVVVVCSNRREQTLILSQLGELFREHQPENTHHSSNGSLRITDAAEVFRSGGATALVVTDAQLGDVRVLRELHQCTSVDCIVHFSLPRGVMLQLEKAEVAEVLAQRGRAILGHTRPFSSRRWWRSADRGEGGVGCVFEPVKVSCWVMLTEHNMKGRVGTCVMELLSEVSEA